LAQYFVSRSESLLASLIEHQHPIDSDKRAGTMRDHNRDAAACAHA
jgi:hypothetical protein